jgi:uridine phosphorylase
LKAVIESRQSKAKLARLTDPIHLHPTALLLAQTLLEKPRMFNHNRGLWGYTGIAGDGQPLTIQSSGMGGPSAAIVISELADLGARQLIRVGTCGSLHPSLPLGRLLIVTEAISADGTSRALGGRERLHPSQSLLSALQAGAAQIATSGPVVSTDLFYEARDGLEAGWRAAGALAVEMETATLFSLAEHRGLAVASLLLVSDVLYPARTRISADRLRDAEHRLGEVALAALTG